MSPDYQNVQSTSSSLLKTESVRVARYLLVGFSTFLFDLLLLWIFVEFFRIHLPIATFVAFMIAVSCNYFISRIWVFTGTKRHVVFGYFNFIAAAALAGVFIVVLVWGMTTYFEMWYTVARVIAAAVVGTGNYLFNLLLNFKVFGKLLRH